MMRHDGRTFVGIFYKFWVTRRNFTLLHFAFRILPRSVGAIPKETDGAHPGIVFRFQAYVYSDYGGGK